MKSTLILGLLIIFLSTNFGNVNNQINNEVEITKIKYHFGDASVAPKYHRSYTIVAERDSINVKVLCYGDVLAEKNVKLDSLQFDTLVANIKKFNIKNKKIQNENRGCTGGTSESISYFNEAEELFSGYVYHCGGENYGDMKGETKDFGGELRKLIPDFALLLQ